MTANIQRASAIERPSTDRWLAATFVAGLAVALLVRAWLLPTAGLVGDLDQFVLWAHGLAVSPLSRAYDQNLSFPPVMVYVWTALGAVEPALRQVTTSADPAIRAVMKIPATIADFGIGAVVAWHLRATPRWAVAGSLLVILHPAVVDVSAWWGQYESIYVLAGVVACVLAMRGHNLWAAAALGVALMTKPQALPFVVPLAAWILAKDGWRGAARAAGVTVAVVVALWLPFLAAGGVQRYARNLSTYQGDIFAILSLRAWNAWWLVQEAFAGGSFVSDQGAIAGPITLRFVGYGLAALGEVAVFALVLRSRSPRALPLGMAAAVLVAFCLLTTMHERYAFGVLAFLPLAFPDRRVLGLAIAFGIVFTLNLLAAVPPTPEIGALLPVGGVLGVVGSVAMLAVVAATIWLLAEEASVGRPASRSAGVATRPAAAAKRDGVPPQVVG